LQLLLLAARFTQKSLLLTRRKHRKPLHQSCDSPATAHAVLLSLRCTCCTLRKLRTLPAMPSVPHST
jgi:hypothetical protein